MLESTTYPGATEELVAPIQPFDYSMTLVRAMYLAAKAAWLRRAGPFETA